MISPLAANVAAAHLGFGIGWIAWIVIGGLAGWAASKIMDTDAQQGLLLSIVVGIVGALLGGFLLSLFDVGTYGFGWVLTFITALVGACILLFLVRLVTGRR